MYIWALIQSFKPYYVCLIWELASYIISTIEPWTFDGHWYCTKYMQWRKSENICKKH